MPEKTKEAMEDVQFPLNQRLLEEASKIKEEREVIKERLQKIESSRDDVSKSVYEKVKTDYVTKLNANTDQLLEKKQDIDRELASLYEAKEKVAENVSNHKEHLEEINFRNSLGEFKKDEYHKKSTEEKEKLQKFEKILSAVESNIEQYESLFADEEDLAGEMSELEDLPAPPPPEGVKEKQEPETEEEYHIEEGEDYFSPNTEEISLESEIKKSTEKTAAGTEEEKPKQPEEEKEEPQKIILKPVLRIEEGENSGKEIEIDKEQITFGRASTNDMVLKEAKVSRQHAQIKKQGEEYLIEDLQSSNGVFVNGEKIKEHVLSDGDKIQIGDFVLSFSIPNK